MSHQHEQRTVAVIGGGVSGLTCAYELIERAERLPGKVEVLCFESGSRTGGNIRSEPAEDFLCEWGPNGFLDSAQTTLTLVRRLGLNERVLPAADAAGARFIFRDGRLRAVPTSPGAFFRSDILPLTGKLRLCFEPLMRKPKPGIDESVFDFAARRIGRRAAAVMVDAMVSGIYAGDAQNLSLEATFPKMRDMERDHGSLFAAMLARRKKVDAETAKKPAHERGGPSGPAGHLTSFRGGMQELVDTLAQAVGDRLRLNTAVRAISDLGQRGFRLLFDEGPPLDVDAVVVACPSWGAAPMLESMDPTLAKAIGEIPAAPLAVVHFGYRTQALGDQPTGFGFLVPRGQGVRILGTLWSSDIFPGRAPEGSRLFTTMIGGAHDREAIELSDSALADAVRQDLERCMGLAVRPYMVRIFRHERGIPQYTIGHPSRLATIDERLAEHPGLWLAGNSYRGIAVNACIEEAPGVAEATLEHLAGDAEINRAL